MLRNAAEHVTLRRRWRQNASAVGRSLLAVAIVAIGLPLASIVSPDGVADADPATGPGFVSQTATGALTAGTVPDGTCRALVRATGGAGASSNTTAAPIPDGGRGGGAAVVNATLTVLPGQAYSGSVGGGAPLPNGTGPTGGAGGVGGGGTGGIVPAASPHPGGGGGGRTVVNLAGLPAAIAGGGGGGAAAHQAAAGHGGLAGIPAVAGTAGVGATGLNGLDNPIGPSVGGGLGGQAAAGGTGGVHSTTATLNGTAGGPTATGIGGNGGTDTNADAGGGGGAGYTGGGGGSSTVGQNPATGGGGGGGSSWVAATSPVVAATIPSAITGSNTPASALINAARTTGAGANGSLGIDWLPCEYNLNLIKTVSPTTVNAGDKATWTIAITNNGPDPMTRGDTIDLTDTLPAGPNAATPGPAYNVVSLATTGGSDANMTSGAVTCTGVAVASSMPAATNCSRPYAAAAGTPGAPAAGGTRGLNVGETLTIVYEQVISNTAPCATITNTATVKDRPTANLTTSGTGIDTNTIGTTITDTVPTPLTISCYDLAITKVTNPTVLTLGTITWTVTVTNNGPGSMDGPVATVANPLVVTDVFPGAPNVSAPTFVSATGPAGACTFAAPTTTCATGLPALGQQVFTFTQTVLPAASDGTIISNTATVSDPRTGDTNDSATRSTTVRAASLTLNKTLPSRANSADQVTVSIVNGATTVDSATTVGAGTTATTGANVVGAATYTLSESMAAGSVSSINQYTNSISCTNSNATSTTVLPAGPGSSFTVTPQVSDNITCTFTNTPRPATVRIAKTTVGGVGGFNYTMSNLSSAATTVTTAIGTNPAVSTAFTATALNTNAAITETVLSGWQFTSATCSDANAAVTGNPASFGTVAAPAITVLAANMRAGADITCSFTNTKLATLTISKTAIGGAGSFNYTDTGLTPASFSLSPNPPTTPIVSQVFLNLAPGTYTVTELASAGFRLADITCADLAGGATGSTNTPTVASGLLSVTLVNGADYNCTYTNIKDANISVIKNTVGGDGTFTFTTAGTGNTSDPAPSIITTAGTGSDAFTVSFGTATPTRTITITEDQPPVGWVLTAIACTNASAAPVGVVDLPTRSATFTANPGDAISCRFTNEKLPTVVIRKQSLGGTDTFSFSGGTNGLPPSVSLNTGNSNPISSSAITLTALNVATSITETIPTNYTLTSAVCVDESAATVSTSLAGGTLTINPSAVVGGADLTCTFTNTRKSAQVRFDKAWVDAEVGNGVTLSAVGGTNDPTLVAVADTTNEVDAGTAVTVYAGETLTLSETFDIGSATNYTTVLACSGGSDGNPADGLSIVAADDGASVVCTYTNTGLPDINATKAAGSVSGPTPAGDYTATYVVTVANTGIAPTTYGSLIDTPAFDPNLQISGAAWTTSASAGAPPAGGSAVGAGPYTLAASATAIGPARSHTYSMTVTFSYIAYTAVSLCGAAGTGLYNSVTLASGESTTADNDACVPPPAPPSPSVVVVKTASPTTVTGAGQTVNYSFAVTNDGDVTLTAIDVADPLPGLSAVTCLVTVLAPSASTTCAATYITTQADIDGGVIDNTATASGVAPNGSSVNDTDSETVTATQAGSIDVQKTALPTTVSAAGQTVNYSFAVTNNGNVTLTAIDVADPLPGLSAVTCPVTALAPAASMTCTATYTTTQADIDAGAIDNTATATGTPPVGPVVSDGDPATVVAASAPSIDLQKTALPSTVNAVGQLVTYSFVVANTGNVTLSLIGVSDPIPGLSSITCPASTLAPAASTTCTATRTVTLADMNFGSIPNTATVTGTPPIGPDVSDTDSETIAVAQTPSIDVEKTASPTTVSAAGQTVDYSFLVTNTGNVTLTNVGVTDPLPGLGAVTCPVTSLDPGESTTCTAAYVVTQVDVNAGAINNTATGSGTPPNGPAVTDAGTDTVTAIRTPSIDVQKSATPNNVTAVGQTVTYSFLVTNTGNVTLTSVGVADPLPGLGAVSCPLSTLDPGDLTTCTATYVVTLADMDSGAINNTATASGTPPTGAPVTDTDAETVTAANAPAIQIVKAASVATVAAVGDTVNYSFEVTNTGNVSLTGVVVTDPLPGLSAPTCPVTTLAVGVATVCTATYLVTQADLDAGAINNTASVTANPPTGAAVTDSSSATVDATQLPAIEVVKSANPTMVTGAGQTVTYSFVVTNTGNVTLASVDVSDPLPGLSLVTCAAATLAPAASTTCGATRDVTLADMDAGAINNTATASGTSPSNVQVTDASSATVTATQSPSIDVVKTASPTTVTTAGQSITYSFEVTNTGNVTLAGLGVVDPLPGLAGLSCPVTTLIPATSTTCTATYTVIQSDLDAGAINNIATASGAPFGGPVVTDADAETVIATQTASIELVKSASPSSVSSAGETVTYSFVVTNIGNVTLTGVGVTDPLPGLSVVTCPVSSLAPAVSTTCAATYLVTQADVDAGAINNTATAIGTPPVGLAVTDSDPATVVADPAPAIEVVKSASPSTVSAAGETVTYSFVVTNIGNVTLTGVGVSDPLPGLSAVTCPVSSLAPAVSTTCAATYLVTQADVDAGAIDNTAVASGNPPTGPVVSDPDSEVVLATAAPSVDVAKTASPTTVTAAGEMVTYSFVVTNIGNVTLTGVGVTDPLPGLSVVTCPVSSLAPAVSTTCAATYLVTQADIDAGAINNTATASGTPPTGPAVVDSDPATVVADPAPAIEVVKTASPTTVTAAGETVTYSFVVTNIGNVTLTGVGVTDPLPGLSVVTCPVSSLAPAVSTTCAATYLVTQADVDSGVINNTAVASGSPPTGPAVSDPDSEVVLATAAPSVDVVKTASPTTVTAAGETVTYSFVVTNTGNVTLTGVGVTDPLPGLSVVTCPASMLVPVASTTCTATYVVTQADIDAGAINNTATASGTPPTGPAVVDTDPATVTVTQTASLELVKTASPTTVTAAGQTITYSFEVANTGTVTLTAIVVTDPLPGLSAVTCPASTLAPGASTTCSATYLVTQTDIDTGAINNLASVSGTPPTGPAVTDSDPATVLATQVPAVSLVKTATPTTVTSAGQSVAYSFVVTNSGNVTLTGVGVSDPLPGLSGITCPTSTLAPAASTTCTATYVVLQTDVDAGVINNTATATGTPPTGPAVTDVDSETVAVTQSPSIVLVKSATPTTVTSAGQSVAYSFVVTNSGNVTLTGVGVSDPLPGLSGITCPAGTLAPAASTTCTATYVTTQADVDSGAISNTATAAGTPPAGPAVTDSDVEIVTATPAPAIGVVKTASPTSVSAAGQTISYSFVVTNTGNLTLTGIAVTDPLPGLSGVACPVSTLLPSASTTCTATYTVSQTDVDAGAVNNTASVVGTPPTGPVVNDADTATVTAAPTPSMSLVKSASPTTVTAAGQTVNYSFLVTNTGSVTLTGVAVTDPLPGLSAVTCLATTLAPTASTTCTATYSATQADIDNGQIANTATASGAPPVGPPVTDIDTTTVTATQSPSIDMQKTATPTFVTAAGQTVAYSFLVTNTGNVSLTGVAVTDPLPGLSAVTCQATTLAPAASTTCTATYAASQADIDNGQIDNTATASGAPPVGTAVTATDDATVTSTPAPSIGLVKSAGVASYSAAGQVVTFTFRVTNTGNVTLSGIAVSDPLPGLGAVACPSATLAPTAGMDCTAAYTVTQADVDTGQLINAASVSGTPPVGPAVTDADTVTLPAATVSAISLVKSAAPTTNLVVGSVLTYSFLVTNTGNVTLTDVGVSDPLPGLSAIVCATTTLAPAVSVTCTATYLVTLADVDAGVIFNLANASGTPPSGSRIQADDTNAINLVQSPQITLTKTVAPSTVGAPGSGVTFTLVATNTGNVTLNDVVVNDPMPGLSAINCGSFDGTLAPLESVTCTASYVVTQADINRGSISNTATVVGSSALTGVSVADTGTVSVVVSARPEIRLVKSVSPTVAAVGASVIYTFVVINVGNVRLTGVAIADPLIGLSAISCPGFDELLEPGESTTCTASYLVGATSSGSITNRATVSGVVSGTITRVDSSSTAVLTVSRPVFPATGADSMPLVWFAGLVTVFGWLVLSVSRRRIKA
jgi:uncharacterized repeat protein (TIGR01451 family)